MSRSLFVAALAVCGLAELAMSTVLDVPLAALAFAAGFLTCAALLYRRMSMPPAVIGIVLLVIDGAATPFYQRSSWVDWLLQLAFAAACLVGVAAGITTLRQHRHASDAVPA